MYPQTQYRLEPIRTDQAAQHLRKCLLHYFTTVCPERYGIQIPVDNPESQASAEVDCVLRFNLPDPLATSAHFSIEHIGGNVFEIIGGLEGHPSERFSCCVAQPPSEDDLAALGETIGEYLLAKIQEDVGAYVLRHRDQVAPCLSQVAQEAC